MGDGDEIARQVFRAIWAECAKHEHTKRVGDPENIPPRDDSEYDGPPKYPIDPWWDGQAVLPPWHRRRRR